MAIINPAIPQVYAPAGTTGQPPVQSFLASSHCNDGDFVLATAGQIAPVAANATTVTGIAMRDSLANYGGSIQATSSLSNWYGFSQVDTPLVPADAAETMVALVGPPMEVEINLTGTTGWISGGTQQANVGTAIGLAIANTVYLADPTASNKIGEIVELVSFPSPGGNQNGVGDLGSRVRVRIYQTALS